MSPATSTAPKNPPITIPAMAPSEREFLLEFPSLGVDAPMDSLFEQRKVQMHLSIFYVLACGSYGHCNSGLTFQQDTRKNAKATKLNLHIDAEVRTRCTSKVHSVRNVQVQLIGGKPQLGRISRISGKRVHLCEMKHSMLVR